MTYVVIDQEGHAQSRPGAPAGDNLWHLLGGVPEMIRTQVPGLVFWVNDDFQRLEAEGKVTRNPIASVLAVGVGVSEAAFAGPVVMTGLARDPLEGYSPDELDDLLELAALTMVADIRAAVLGEGDTRHIPPRTVEAMRRGAEYARTVPYRGATAYTMSIDEFLRGLGE